jgi:Mg-chelatase subunit ChlD
MVPSPFRVERFEERANRHLAAVALAFIVSLAVHLGLMVTIKDWLLESVELAAAGTPPPADRPPLRIERLPLDPERALGNPETGDPREGAGVGIPREMVRELARLPDPALITPPARRMETLAGTLVSDRAPPRQPTALGWQPRQQIVAIIDRVVKDDLATLPRREIPRIERVARAPDFVPAVDVTRDRFGGETEPQAQPAAAAALRDQALAASDTVPEAGDVALDEAATPDAAINRFGEAPGEVTDYFAVDSRLMARLETFAPEGDRGRHYFRLQVTRRGEQELPVVPKDIIFLQDSSRSLAEERLYFCRQALKTLLTRLNPGDRFNVVKFSGAAEFCFPSWSAVQPAALEAATAFIDAMRSEGETDLFASVRALQTLPRDPARPLIAVVITDGRPTAGLTESTEIIGAFTRINDGACSVFALGTHGRANAYLLDLLTFCNRGGSALVTSGRWDIPRRIEELAAGISRPVLGNVSVATDLASQADLHPLPSANLYADRTLEYYGSTPPGVTNVVVHVRGEGGEARCDVIFRLDLASAPRGAESIRQDWARRKMHSLIGAYARKPDMALQEEMRALSRQYGLPIPYRDEF